MIFRRSAVRARPAPVRTAVAGSGTAAAGGPSGPVVAPLREFAPLTVSALNVVGASERRLSNANPLTNPLDQERNQRKKIEESKAGVIAGQIPGRRDQRAVELGVSRRHDNCQDRDLAVQRSERQV